MASLTRIPHARVLQRLVSIYLKSYQNLLTGLVYEKPLVRSLQTTADSTKLTEPPSDPSQPFTVTLHEDSFDSFRCDKPDLNVEVSKDNLIKWYSQMTTMRRMEMAADALYKAKLIRGFCHLAIGQVRVIIKMAYAGLNDLPSRKPFLSALSPR